MTAVAAATCVPANVRDSPTNGKRRHVPPSSLSGYGDDDWIPNDKCPSCGAPVLTLHRGSDFAMQFTCRHGTPRGHPTLNARKATPAPHARGGPLR